jgi:hypothetical protein
LSFRAKNHFVRRGVFHLRLHEAGGDDVVSAAFEDYLRQRLRRGTVEDGAVGCGEYSAVAGAGEDVVFGTIKNRARVVGAEAAESAVSVFGGAEEEAGAVVGWIGENF